MQTENFTQTIAVTFQFLEEALSRVLALAPVGDALDLARLVPECSRPAQRLILSELIKLDMAKAFERGLARNLDFYRALFESHFDFDQVPLDLVLDEIQIASRAGAPPDLALLRIRFPHLSSVLEEVLVIPSTSCSSNRLEKPPSFEEGERVDDFTILKLLGRGGFASVYLARQNSMQRLVALKVSQHGSNEPVALSQLDHPNIVRVFDQRQIQQPRAVLLYMQYVPGGTLLEVIRASSGTLESQLNGRCLLDSIDRALLEAGQQAPERNPPRDNLAELDWPRVVAWLGIQLAEGLATAHERGIMHRDVKPANILLASDAVPKLADFNVSYGGNVTDVGAAVHFGGSLAYMSPEQLLVARGRDLQGAEELDLRSDLFSLSMVLWELWQGNPPVVPTQMFSSIQEAVDQQLAMRRQSPQLFRLSTTAAARVLEKTLRKGLSYERVLRPRNGRELAGSLRLAFSEKAAEYFEPSDHSLYRRMRRWPVLLTTAVLVFIPNGLAGSLNYQYNLASIRADHPESVDQFVTLSWWINCIAFPLGGLILFVLTRPVQKTLDHALLDEVSGETQIQAIWNLGHRAAMIGGLMWVIAGLVFPIVLAQMDPTFRIVDAVEFFLSLTICGGIAWIYPFFGISLLATEVYYPSIVAPAMVDPDFESQTRLLKRRATVHLACAALIPLLGLALLATQQVLGAHRTTVNQFLLVIVLLTAIALAFAFLLHQRLQFAHQHLGTVLAKATLLQ